jgi:hypothetical protein
VLPRTQRRRVRRAAGGGAVNLLRATTRRCRRSALTVRPRLARQSA